MKCLDFKTPNQVLFGINLPVALVNSLRMKMKSDDTLINFMKAAVLECCSPDIYEHIVHSKGFLAASDKLKKDLISYAQKDPSQGRDTEIIIRTSLSFSAVMHYRLANIFVCNKDLAINKELKEMYACLISSRGKLKSGAEIHHKAKVQAPFVLDHGYGTVIGETTEIGAHCYILGGVVLGARGISENDNIKRHPTIGNNVDIGAFSSILGAVNIGDNVFIGPHCTIVENIPKNGKVTNKQYQHQIYTKREQ